MSAALCELRAAGFKGCQQIYLNPLATLLFWRAYLLQLEFEKLIGFVVFIVSPLKVGEKIPAGFGLPV